MSKTIQRNTGLLKFDSVSQMRSFTGGAGLMDDDVVILSASSGSGMFYWDANSSATDDGVDTVKITSWVGNGRFIRRKTNAENIEFDPAGTGAETRSVEDKLRKTILSKEYGAVGSGSVSDTAGIQRVFDRAVTYNASEIVIEAGTYLLTNPNNDLERTAAVVIRGLKNCTIRGEKGAKFTQSATGSATDGFAFFRLEQCENVHFTGFELDGTGMTVTTGANRLNGIICVNYDVNDAATDLANVNRQLEFSHLYIHDSGGGISVARRSTSLEDTPMTEGLSVHDCRIENILGVDHGVAAPRVRNAHVYNNRFVNDIENETIQDNMAVDISSGSEVAHVHNNYVYGFGFGMKCESIKDVGPASNEVRASKRVLFENNYLDEIGDPELLVWPGPSGGDTFGIKVNGKDCAARNNTVKARTVDVTTGGLQFGIVVVNTHDQDSHSEISNNFTLGSEYGIVHNDTTASTLECSVDISDNRCKNNGLYGIQAQSNCDIDDNRIDGAGESAIIIQGTVRNTFVRRNFAYNCGTDDNSTISDTVVYVQDTTGAIGLLVFEDNVIVDDRGGSACSYGYYLAAGLTRTNPIILKAGYTSGLATGVAFDKYFSINGTSYSLDGVTNTGPRTIYVTNSPSAIAPWNAMAWRVGDRAILTNPGPDGNNMVLVGWICTTAGTPGTWSPQYVSTVSPAT